MAGWLGRWVPPLPCRFLLSCCLAVLMAKQELVRWVGAGCCPLLPCCVAFFLGVLLPCLPSFCRLAFCVAACFWGTAAPAAPCSPCPLLTLPPAHPAHPPACLLCSLVHDIIGKHSDLMAMFNEFLMRCEVGPDDPYTRQYPRDRNRVSGESLRGDVTAEEWDGGCGRSKWQEGGWLAGRLAGSRGQHTEDAETSLLFTPKLHTPLPACLPVPAWLRRTTLWRSTSACPSASLTCPPGSAAPPPTCCCPPTTPSSRPAGARPWAWRCSTTSGCRSPADRRTTPSRWAGVREGGWVGGGWVGGWPFACRSCFDRALGIALFEHASLLPSLPPLRVALPPLRVALPPRSTTARTSTRRRCSGRRTTTLSWT